MASVKAKMVEALRSERCPEITEEFLDKTYGITTEELRSCINTYDKHGPDGLKVRTRRVKK